METTTTNFNNNNTEINPLINGTEQKIIDVLQKTAEKRRWMFSDITTAAVLDGDKNCLVLNEILDICREYHDGNLFASIRMIFMMGAKTNIKFVSNDEFNAKKYWTHGGTSYTNDFHKGSLSFFYVIKAFADYEEMPDQIRIAANKYENKQNCLDKIPFIREAILKRHEFGITSKNNTIEESFIHEYSLYEKRFCKF